MRLLIVAALFLIFSTACASPMYGVFSSAKSIMDLSNNEFTELLDQSEISKTIAIASLGSLREVSFDHKTYQVLGLAAIPGDHRDFEKEEKRFEGKKLVGRKEIGHFHYLIFDGANMFSPHVPPEFEESTNNPNFKRIQTEAGLAYNARWSTMGRMNKDPQNYFYESGPTGHITAVYVGERQSLDAVLGMETATRNRIA